MLNLELYFDDSGTHRESPVAVAACYIADKRQWDEFVRNWDEVRISEGVDVFHMSDFMAKPEKGVKPFCDWNKQKRERVWGKVASIIRARARHGFAVSVSKDDYDELALPILKKEYAKNHYAFAVKFLIGAIADWRAKYKITEPMQFVFDRVKKGDGGKGEIMDVWNTLELLPNAESIWGLAKDGYGFQDKSVFKPLQSADILAWHMYDYMMNTILKKQNPAKMRHSFRCLRDKRPITAGFITRENLHELRDSMEQFEKETGKSPLMIVEAKRQKQMKDEI